jgi:hypothetical protein
LVGVASLRAGQDVVAVLHDGRAALRVQQAPAAEGDAAA